MKQLILFLGLFICVQTTRSQVSYTWNGSVSSAWNTPANWTPNGIPGIADNVTVVTAVNTCILSATQSINNITLTSGTLNLGGFTLTVGGPTAIFTTGTVQNGTINITAATSATFGNGPVVMNCIVNLTSATVTFRNTTFQNTINITKSGASNDVSNGNNVFNGVSSITNSGSGYMILGNTNPDIWNNDVFFTDNGSERLLPCWASVGNQFNGNISVNTAGSAIGIQFCGGNATATATLAATKTITAGATGLTAGYLYLKQFTQLGNAPISLTATGTSVLYLGPSSNFGGTIAVSSPDIWVQGATYNSPASFTKTGGSSNHNNQYQNIFSSTCTINQQSNTGYFMLGYNSNDLFNDNITVTSIGSGGIYLGWVGGTGTPTLAAGKTISVGGAGFSAGFLNFNTFTQLGNAPINLTFTGANSSINFARGSVIGGNLTTNTPDVFFSGCTFNGTVNATKTGIGNDAGVGGNIFQAATVITNSGSGYLIFGNGAADKWNSNVSFNSTGSSYIALGWNSVGNTSNGNITVTSSGSSTGIQFCPNSGSAFALAAGSSLQIGAGGFSSGTLLLKQFTQSGNAAINLSLTGATTVMQVGPSSAIGGNFTVTSPRILVNGAVYTNPVNLTKTGATGEWSSGGNTFNSTLTVNQTGSGYFGFANGSPDIYNGDVYANNNSTERIIFGNNPAGNQFNGNIILTQVGSSVGIAFGWSATTSETLAAGKTISIGAAGFSVGYLQIEQFTQLGNMPINLLLTGTSSLTVGPNSSIGGNLTSTSASLYLNGSTFNGTTDLTKNGATGDFSTGGNVFNGACSITNSGSSFLVLGNTNPDIWNSDVTFTDNGSERLLPCWASVGNQFNGNIFVNTAGSASGIQFCGGNLTATANLAATMTIQAGATGLTAGYLILKQFTQSGTTPVNLTLSNTATYLQFGPSATFGGSITSSSPGLFFNGCIFNGTINCTKTGVSNDASIGNNIFNGISNMTNAGAGFLLLGNGSKDQFNTTATFNNTGSSYLYVAYNSPNNIFGGVTTFNNTPTANTLIYVSWLSTGTSFNDNVVVSSTNGQGVQFCGGNATATASLSAGKTINVGIGGFSAGTLLLRQFTQVGATAQNLTLTGSGNLTFGPSSSFGGNVTTLSPTLLFNGCNFSGSVTSTKNGATNDASTGSNIFNGITDLTDAGAGYLLLGNGNQDQFNTTTTFNNTGSSYVYVAYNSSNNIFGGVTTFNNAPTANTLIYVGWLSTGTTFNDNIVVTSTNGQGVQFCGGNATATASLSAGKTINVGAGGFSAGTLLLRQFTQVGATAQSLTLTGSGNLTFGPSSSFGGNVTTLSPTLFFNGCNFSGSVTSTKNGASNDGSIGNNVFNGSFTLTNTGAGYFLMGNGNPDLWQSTATFNNLSTGQHMYVAYNSTGNIFNGDVVFNNQPTSNGLWIYTNNSGINTQFNGNISVINVNGGGVYFGNGTGTATLASGKTINIGAGGFNFGGLIFRNFIQTGLGTAQNIITTGTSYIQYGAAASFDGPVTSSSPGLFFNGSTFNGIINCTKTGSTNDQSIGNNVFNGAATFVNNGTGYLLMTSTSPDAYNGNVTFVQNNTGLIYPNYNTNCTYAGNLTISSPAASAITFGANTGTATLSGSSVQTINASVGTPTPVLTRLVIANTGAGVTLSNTSINVSKNLTLTSGLLNTTTTFILTMLNGSVTAPGTALSTSFINGPMRYQKASAGASTLNFPIGSGSDSRPVVLTLNHTTGNLYTYQAQLFNASAVALGYTLPITVDIVSGVHYYTISRVNAASVIQPTFELSGNQTIQIFFGSNDVVRNGGTLTIVKNTNINPTKWIDIGGTGGPVFTGANLTGSISSTSLPTAFNSFSTFALGDALGGSNVLPIRLLYFNAIRDNTQVDLSWATATESNNSHFTIEKSKDAVNFEFLENINSSAEQGNSSTALSYSALDLNPYGGISFYRLKQTDIDGNYTYSKIVSVNFDKSQNISIYPNPTSGTIYVNGINPHENSLVVQWFDAGGRKILQQSVKVQNGIARLDPRLENGVYILKFMTANGMAQSQNIIIKK